MNPEPNPFEIIKMLNELSYMECYTCHNYFFIHEIGEEGINDPTYCPYCGVEFVDTWEPNEEEQ